MTTTTSATQLDTDVQRFLELDARKHEIEAEQAEIKERIRALGIGSHSAAGMTINVTPNRRFNADHAAKVLPESLAALCIKTTTAIDAGLAKENLPPAVYESCMVEVGQPRVVVK